MSYIITCGDEGAQLNEGTRLGFVGAGFRLAGFSEVLKLLPKLLGQKKLIVAASEENDWTKAQLALNDWDQVNASMQQHIEAMADREKLQYAGCLSFADPQLLMEGVKGHMVRPHGVHIANKICLTLGGGEQKFNLGCYIISADWVTLAKPALVKEVLNAQIAFYTKLAGKELPIILEETGSLGSEVAEKNKAALHKAGIIVAN
jgi:hypothetical protein